MMTNPDVVFAADPRHGLVARSGWEQEEAQTVLRDLGWHWVEELHALVPPDDVPEVDAGLQAVEELHLHGHRTGYAVGPYGTMRLTPDRAEQVFTKVVVREPSEDRFDAAADHDQRVGGRTRRSNYGDLGTSEESPTPHDPGSLGI
ncbi:hypothetical protein [Streptomyces sp. NPDC050546]|uniref:hypothetical protein n=1 Tax=Streptomyces sp. NPDC050546 TaxID=3365628 RepID=UPI0037A4C8E2